MRLNIIITMFLFAPGITVNGQNGKNESATSSFYAALSSENLDSINTELQEMSKFSGINKDAMEGVLLMKKAGLVSGLSTKYKLFKSGQKKLESAIAKESENTEFRFFRLMIQENAPGILNYSGQIDEDSQLIRAGYKNLPQVVQMAITSYSKKSNVLKPESF